RAAGLRRLRVVSEGSDVVGVRRVAGRQDAAVRRVAGQADAAQPDEVAERAEVGRERAVAEADDHKAAVRMRIEEVELELAADAGAAVVDEEAEGADARVEVEVGARGGRVERQLRD